MTTDPHSTFYAERDRRLAHVAESLGRLTSASNALNRNIEGLLHFLSMNAGLTGKRAASVAIGQHFGSVSALWSHFQDSTSASGSHQGAPGATAAPTSEASQSAHQDPTTRVLVNPDAETLPQGVAPGGGEIRASFRRPVV